VYFLPFQVNIPSGPCFLRSALKVSPNDLSAAGAAFLSFLEELENIFKLP
jgi:hypothetical protein